MRAPKIGCNTVPGILKLYDSVAIGVGIGIIDAARKRQNPGCRWHLSCPVYRPTSARRPRFIEGHPPVQPVNAVDNTIIIDISGPQLLCMTPVNTGK